ncbi:MAG TPA: hypothetical protein VFQ53_21425 [Kofleriaceae bacterium]|nr:hypothetical protein [Kofleriaceae bacterium]
MTEMRRADRAYILAMCAIIGGAFAYAACDWGRWPRLTYFPFRGELALSTDASPTAIVYPGMVAWGLGGALCGALVGALLLRIVPRPWPDRVLHLFGAWALTAILLAGGYFTWSLWPW